MRATFDANILVYAADLDAGERNKAAVRLLERAAAAGESVLLLQALGEFFHASTRKRLATPADAHHLVEGWLAIFPVHAATIACLGSAIALAKRDGLSYWDAMLCATAHEANCGYLLSEDLQDGRRFGSLTVVNPLAAANTDLLDRIFSPP
jgi:predicted nucleic acid-binding protein